MRIARGLILAAAAAALAGCTGPGATPPGTASSRPSASPGAWTSPGAVSAQAPSGRSPHGAIDLLQTDAPISPANSGGAGTKVSNVTDLLAALRQQEPGKTVDVTVRRGSTGQKLQVGLCDLAQQQ